MFFGQIFNRLANRTGEANKSRKAVSEQLTAEEKETLKEQLIPTNNDLNTKSQLKKALENIEERIRTEGTSDQLLIQKAEILLRRNKLNQAQGILNQVSKSRSDQKSTERANKLLTLVHQLKQSDSEAKNQDLLTDLHSIARKYCRKLSDLPITHNPSKPIEITQIVRKEARRARTNELPKLSYELIQKIQEAGHTSPWLTQDMALSLNMMGQSEKALEMLNDLKKTNAGEKISNSIQENIIAIKREAKDAQVKTNIYLTKQALALAKGNNLKTLFIPSVKSLNQKTNAKTLVFKEARASLAKNPQACLALTDSILDYFQGDLAALQLKGEALSALKDEKKAIEIWKELANSKNQDISQKAKALIRINITKRVELSSKTTSSDAAVSLYVKEHIKHKIVPTLNEDICKILKKINPEQIGASQPELQRQKFELILNRKLIEQLEAQHNKQKPLKKSAQSQKRKI